MNRFLTISSAGILIFILIACNAADIKQPQVSATVLPTTETPFEIAKTPIFSDQTSSPSLTLTKKPSLFPLSDPGPFSVGSLDFSLIDDSRNGRTLPVTIWYPAIKPADSKSTGPFKNAPPDLNGAPYPLILTGTDSGKYIFKNALVSHGFVMVIVDFPDEYNNWDFWLIDHPRDMLFVLNHIASDPPEGLAGVINSNQVGIAGYSGDGSNALTFSGARINPEYYLSYCEKSQNNEFDVSEWYIEFTCALSDNWKTFETNAGIELTNNDNGLWQPITDERIRAVMPMATDGAWLYGKRGLAMADRPILFIQATEDSTYQPTEAAFIFENIGSPEQFMISFIGENHMSMLEAGSKKRMNHFATAFFGYYLQGREDYGVYFSEEFVDQFDDLAWGIYREK